MKTFDEWNKDEQIPKEFEDFGTYIWLACQEECARLCAEAAEKYRIDTSLRVYTGLVVAKSCEDLSRAILGDTDV